MRPGRWRPRAWMLSGGAVALWMALGGWLAAPVASSDSHGGLGYLAGDFSAMSLASNESFSGAKLVGKAYPVLLTPKPASPEVRGPIWTHGCPAGAKTVTFARQVWLPGEPNYGGSFTYGSVLGRDEFSALSKIELIVNGQTILDQRMPVQTAAYRVPLSSIGELRPFHYGENLIKVRVHRNAPARGNATCNTGDPATALGVVFALNGGFETDLAVSPPLPSSYYKPKAGEPYVVQGIHVHYRNDGPDWEPGGTAWIEITGPNKVIIGSYPSPAPPLTNCQVTDNPNGITHRVTCSLDGFAPKSVAVLNVIYREPTQRADSSVYFSWYIGAGAVGDLNPNNNQSHTTIVYCGTASTTPACR